MTKKDYELLARSIKEQWSLEVAAHKGVGEHSMVVHNTALRIAYALETDNPRFDRERFLEECGVISLVQGRLEELRRELRAERISYGEIAELQSLAKFIDKDDVELLEAAGVPEGEKA